MKTTKGKTRNTFLLILLIFFTFALSGCGTDYVSENTIIEDLKQNDIFSVHNVDIESFEIIKRLSEEEKDSIFVNVKGKNSVYSISLNFKMIYLQYNDGWLIETIEQYEDSGGFINEIIPISGPSQEVIDEFTSQYDWESIASFAKWLEKDVIWELTPTEDISLESYYGQAKYMCTAVCEYSYVVETVTFPVIFYFSSVSSDNIYTWHTYNYENVLLHETERSVEFKPNICTNWTAEGISAYVKTGFHIKELKPHNDQTLRLATVDSYYFYDGTDKKYETTGVLKLVANMNQNTGKISSLELYFMSDSDNPPKECADLYFHNNKVLQSSYDYSLGIFEHPILYTAQE